MRTRTRKLLLFVGSLVAMLGGMALYLATLNEPAPADDLVEDTTAATMPDDETMRHLLNTQVGPAQKIEYPIYQSSRKRKGDPKEIRRAAVIRADESHVSGPGQFHLTRPQIWAFLKDGQVLFLKADEGDFVAAEAAKPGFNPTHGLLSGQVTLTVSRLGAKGSGPASRPEESIRVWGMDRVHFNVNENLITTDSVVRMASAQNTPDGKKPLYAFDVRGLSIRWDSVTREITDLKMNTQCAATAERDPFIGRLVSYRGAELGGEKRGGSGAASSGSDRSTAAPATRPRTVVDPKRVQTYRATFNRNVEALFGVRPGDVAARGEWAGRPSGEPLPFEFKLFSDEMLSAMFDFVEGGGESGKAKPATAPDAPARAPVVRVAGPADPEPTASTRPDADGMVLTWHGVLTMVPARRADEPVGADRVVTGQKFAAHAAGNNVLLLSKDGMSVAGQVLDFDLEQMLGEIAGRGGRQVRIDVPANQLGIDCGRACFDGRNNRIRMPTGGHMRGLPPADGAVAASSRPDEPERFFELDWRDHAEVLLARTPEAEKAPPTDGARRRLNFLTGAHFSEATFVGEVRAKQVDSEIRAARAVVSFFEPGSGAKDNQVRLLRAEGAQDRAGRYLDQVHLRLSGRAGGLVGAGEPTTRPDARKKPTPPMDIDCDQFALQMKLSPTSQAAPDRGVAAGRVKLVTETRAVNAERMEMTFAGVPTTQRDKAGRIVMKYVPWEAQAFKNIVITDSAERLTATGSRLHSLIESKQVTLHGNPATVNKDDRAVSGPMIEIDQVNQTIQVIGHGEMTFASDRDFNGDRSDQPVPVKATWERCLGFRPKVGPDGVVSKTEDEAELQGSVRAASGRSYLQGELVRLTFEDRPTTQPDSQPDDLLASTLGKKRLRSMVAEHNVSAKTSEVDPQTRRLLTQMEIASEQLTFDNTTSQMTASGPGTLVLADYRLPAKKATGEVADPLSGGRLRPSQTAFAWTRRMQFNPDALTVTFDTNSNEGAVRMGHRGADTLFLAPDGSPTPRPNTLPTNLNCRSLTCRFVATTRKDPDAAARPAGALGAQTDTVRDIRSLRAEGAVYLRQPDKDGDRILLADVLEYDKERDTVLFGCVSPNNDKNAEIFQLAPDGSRFNQLKVPMIRWDRAAGRIEPFKGSFGGSGP